MQERMGVNIAICAIHFLFLYLVAFISNHGYRQPDDILGISRNQWWAIIILWVPCLLLWEE